MSQAAPAGFAGFKRLCGESGPALRLDPKRPAWIFGAGRFGKDLCAVLRKAGFQVRGFIETKPSASEVTGLPVKAWGDFGPGRADDALLMGIFNHLTPMGELEGLARAAGFRDVFMPWDLYAQFGRDLGWRYWLGEPAAILGNLERIERAHDLLADDESRRCFLRVLAFRLGKDTEFGGFKHPGLQYFNDITLDALPQDVRYVDGGAFNGDTFLELSRRRKVVSAYLFEPDPANFRELVVSARGASAATVCLPLGLMDDCGILSFKAEGLESSALSDQGTVRVAVAALDQVLPGRAVDFIKMDIEGSEARAIRGAERLIKASRPVLAISLYHKPEDLWSLTLQLADLDAGYRFFIRQHCFNSFESVVYAVAK